MKWKSTLKIPEQLEQQKFYVMSMWGRLSTITGQLQQLTQDVKFKLFPILQLLGIAR